MKNSNIEHIKEKSKELFFRYGLKSVSMDDIAKEAGVGKKTVYEFFDSKNNLVYTLADELIRSHESFFKTAQLTANDAIDEVLKQDVGFSSVAKGIRPSFFYELENFFPEVWEEMERYKLKIHKGIIDNLHRGKQEGLYRQDISCKVISDLRLHQLLNVVKPEFLTSLGLGVEHLAEELTVLYLHAITTEKGRKQLEKYLGEIRAAS